MSRIPANPPTTNAAINHQAETIYSPPFPMVPWAATPCCTPRPTTSSAKKSPACAGLSSKLVSQPAVAARAGESSLHRTTWILRYLYV
jgi:hypothetical protein